MADASYNKNLENTSYSPYVIDDQAHKYQDKSRIDFLMLFLNKYYSFEGYNETSDDLYSLMIELMIYTHIWESEAYLKQLTRISYLVQNDKFLWKVDIPEMGKHDLIRNNIRSGFESKKLKIKDVIKKGFHTSLRNAFAHSQFMIDQDNRVIYLDTFKGAKWDISEINFKDWTERFCYSFLINYHFVNIKQKRRENVIKDEFIIPHPLNKNHTKSTKIYYNRNLDSFNFSDHRKY